MPAERGVLVGPNMNDWTYSVRGGSVADDARLADVFIVIPVCKLDAKASRFSSTVRCCCCGAAVSTPLTPDSSFLRKKMGGIYTICHKEIHVRSYTTR